MSPILTELYHHFTPTTPSPEYRAAQEHLSACLSQVDRVFSSEFTQELEDAAFNLLDLDARESFAYGLRLGLALVRELHAL